jgi:hypothetical protein
MRAGPSIELDGPIASAVRHRDRVPWIVTFAALATLAAGLLVQARGMRLGVASIPPFVGGRDVRADLPWTLLAAAVVPAAGLVGTHARRLRPATFAVTAYALTVAVGLAVNTARSGPHGLDAVFDLGPAGSPEAPNEYLAAAPALSYGTHFLLDRFAELVPALPPHAAAHPPGLLVLMAWLRIDGPAGLAVLVIGVGALVAPLSWLIARELGRPEPAARAAGLLCAACPATVLFGVTSADYLYAAVGAAAAWLLLRRPAAGAAALAIASLFGWALLAIGAWAVLVIWRRDGGRSAAAVAAGCAIAVLVLDAMLALAAGYDALGTLHATGLIYRDSVAASRPYAFWLFGSPAAWWLVLGAPLGWLLARAAARGDSAAVALAGIVLTSAALGFTKAETERIWLPFVPLACAAAVAVAPRRIDVTVTVLGLQALVAEILFVTVW